MNWYFSTFSNVNRYWKLVFMYNCTYHSTTHLLNASVVIIYIEYIFKWLNCWFRCNMQIIYEYIHINIQQNLSQSSLVIEQIFNGPLNIQMEIPRCVCLFFLYISELLCTCSIFTHAYPTRSFNIRKYKVQTCEKLNKHSGRFHEVKQSAGFVRITKKCTASLRRFKRDSQG